MSTATAIEKNSLIHKMNINNLQWSVFKDLNFKAHS